MGEAEKGGDEREQRSRGERLELRELVKNTINTAAGRWARGLGKKPWRTPDGDQVGIRRSKEEIALGSLPPLV